MYDFNRKFCFFQKKVAMSDINSLIKHLVAFRDERDWKQFHNPKDLAIALSIEAAELNEVFLWKSHQDTFDLELMSDELADVFSYACLLAESCGLDIQKIVEEKIKKNAIKYPVSKFKGSAKKYTEI